VRIARRQPLALEDDRRRHRQRLDLKRLAAQIARRVQPLEILRERQMILVRSVLLDSRQNRVLVYKSRDVIHMPVRVIARTPSVQPDNFFDAQILRKRLLQLPARDTGIALLHLAQETLLRRQQNSRSIDVNASALEHQSM